MSRKQILSELCILISGIYSPSEHPERAPHLASASSSLSWQSYRTHLRAHILANTVTMGCKRNQDEVDDILYSDDDEREVQSPPKRHRAAPKAAARQSKQQDAQTDPTTGQRFVFAGLDDDDFATVLSDEDLDVEDEQDALAYLRSVRYVHSCCPRCLFLGAQMLRRVAPLYSSALLTR
jgi:predicted Fe-S protein YdhL (DUF1289 family)